LARNDHNFGPVPRASYCIISIDEYSYEVRVDEPNASRRTITGFQSMAESENWIEIQKRHEPRVSLGPQSEGPDTNPQFE